MSKGLEALERIKKLSCLWNIEEDDIRDVVEILPKSCKTIEQELKALEIISPLFDIKYFIEEWYKQGILPQEEYDLIKEVLQ